MRFLLSFSLSALVGFLPPPNAGLRCKCDHLPIEPKQCVNLCFGALLNTLSPDQMKSVLGFDDQLTHDVAALRTAEPIESIADLRPRLSAENFERLKRKIEAAASGHTQQPMVLRAQLAAVAPRTGMESPLTRDQVAALDEEEAREGTTSSTYGELPSTASGFPLLGLIGLASLVASLTLWSLRKGSQPQR